MLILICEGYVVWWLSLEFVDQMVVYPFLPFSFVYWWRIWYLWLCFKSDRLQIRLLLKRKIILTLPILYCLTYQTICKCTFNIMDLKVVRLYYLFSISKQSCLSNLGLMVQIRKLPLPWRLKVVLAFRHFDQILFWFSVMKSRSRKVVIVSVWVPLIIDLGTVVWVIFIHVIKCFDFNNKVIWQIHIINITKSR